MYKFLPGYSEREEGQAYVPIPREDGSLTFSVQLSEKDQKLGRRQLGIAEFCRAFLCYKAVICEEFPDRQKELDAYLAHILDLSSRYSGNAYWLYHTQFLGKPLLSGNMECVLIGQALTLTFCIELFQLGKETFVTTVRIISMHPLHAHSHFQLIIDLPRFPTQFRLPVLVHHIIVLINRNIVPTIRENKSVITLTFVHVSIKRTVNFCISVGAVRKMTTL